MPFHSQGAYIHGTENIRIAVACVDRSIERPKFAVTLLPRWQYLTVVGIQITATEKRG